MTNSSVTIPGMTLREWYAGQALAALGNHVPEGVENISLAEHCNARADYAVMLADAMIAALKENGDA